MAQIDIDFEPDHPKNAIRALRRGWIWSNDRNAFVDGQGRVMFRYPDNNDIRWGRLSESDAVHAHK